MAQTVRSMLVKSLGFASTGASYVNVGDATENALRIVWIQNMTDAELMFSFDAVNDHFPLAANSYVLLDINSNQNQVQSGLTLEVGTILYVRRVGVPTTGSVYFSGFYARGE